MAPTQILLTLALAILSPLTTATPTPPAQDPSLAQFEEHFVNSLPYTSDNATTLRLVGFKRMALPAADVAAFEEAWNAPPSEWRRRRDGGSAAGRHEQHFWYDRARREVRVYFPVEGALLRRSAVEEGGNVFVEADGLGQVVGVGEVVKRDVDGEGRARAVVGRRATDQVSGVEGNVIRDGIIYLETPALPVRHLDGRTTIYDFGVKSLDHDSHSHDHDHDHEVEADQGQGGANLAKRAEGKKGCLENHKGKNCSKAYGINQGRCPMNPDTCMDYNGWKTDCKKGTTTKFGIPTLSKAVKFLGSDCSVSMARGHCWNEVM
ncbi:hypothetical protein MGG_03078 [Pyricularia oryzae 70-15]|uniref:Uncharacterized protein n=3 Tax=Pyricularia oryzae TaxID=318829 RepID=G5EHW6_PYRO7|nr:uncharacterized protein MGG_03078 [Pyricularia oryzae 70-15]ELQ41008.1 hypothetical protein OOU_Y34scaffold00308g18 [Pyricularia oryzae Y34]KAI7916780.1 hypothetical protein M9X92_007733 [Pyricularia oryzae]EAQ71474.1 hypothetical protein MGCH7_ch7g881 [Pyricularia oryzae 70-15]EHA45852.1 hypothetical protein MGG_03078 [Pyricularia oryzae 70-15]KAI7922784.1 hypothetical protein M0657_005403 [Pyricularia oryzae]